MVIESVSWKRYATPFFSPFKVSYGEHTSSEHVIVRLVDSSGKVGYGDATPLWFFTGEVCEAVEVLLDKVVKNNILGIDVFDKQSIATIIGSIPGNYSLKSCVEMAVYDLRAKLLNVPLHKLLGGKIREKVKVSSGIGIMQKEKTVEAATSLVEKGIRSFKIKVAGKTDFEADRIKAVKDAVGLYEKRAVDIFGIKFAKCGGITEARRTIEFASSVDIPCVMISAFETWIGISANLHLASTSENCYYANDLALWTIQKDSMTGPLKVHGDIVEVPDKPGLGTEADRLFEE